MCAGRRFAQLGPHTRTRQPRPPADATEQDRGGRDERSWRTKNASESGPRAQLPAARKLAKGAIASSANEPARIRPAVVIEPAAETPPRAEGALRTLAARAPRGTRRSRNRARGGGPRRRTARRTRPRSGRRAASTGRRQVPCGLTAYPPSSCFRRTIWRQAVRSEVQKRSSRSSSYRALEQLLDRIVRPPAAMNRRGPGDAGFVLNGGFYKRVIALRFSSTYPPAPSGSPRNRCALW